MTKPRRIIVLALLCTLAIATPAAAAPATIDTLPRASGLDAGHGAVVWSRHDDAAKAYRLVVRRNGVNTVPPIDPSPDAFDADVGSNSRGEPAVVYSRCASYKDDRGPRDRCDLYILSLNTGAEREIRNRLAEIVGYSAGSGDSTEIRLVSLRSTSAHRIAFQNIGENNQLYTGLSFSSRKLAWLRGCFENPGSAGSGAYRFGLSTRRYERASHSSTPAGQGRATRRTHRS